MGGTPAWLWPNLLSLDAPVIALVWQDFAARSFGNPLHLAARIVLGLTVWAIYLGDRLLDTRATGPTPKTARHNFSRRHPRALSLLLAAVLVIDALLATVELRRTVFVHGLAVGCCATAYLCTFPLRASGWEKQVVAAMLFSAGVLVVTGAWLGALPLLLPAGLFGGLCFCNLVLMELWERDEDRRLIWLGPAAVAGLAMVRPSGEWQDAVALAGVLLAGVATSGRRLSVDTKRALADAVLLTPLLFR